MHRYTTRNIIVIILLMYGAFSTRNATAQVKLIQLSGLISDEGTGYPIPYSNVLVNHSGRNDVANNWGFFSLVVQNNDTLEFTSIGYAPKMYIVPDTFASNFISIGIFLQQDTIYLPSIAIYPWPAPEDFDQAFLNLQIAQNQDQYQIGYIPGLKTTVDTIPKPPTIMNPISLFYEQVVKPIEWNSRKRGKSKELPVWK